jgi:hypothetical protein
MERWFHVCFQPDIFWPSLHSIHILCDTDVLFDLIFMIYAPSTTAVAENRLHLKCPDSGLTRPLVATQRATVENHHAAHAEEHGSGKRADDHD